MVEDLAWRGRLPLSSTSFESCRFGVRDASFGKSSSLIGSWLEVGSVAVGVPYKWRIPTGKKGMITSDDLEYLRSRHHILDSIELSASREGETLQDHYDCSICLNKWMFKAGVRIPFKFGILEPFMFFVRLQFKSSPTLGESSNRKCRVDRHLSASLLLKKLKLRFFYARFKEVQGVTPSYGVPLQWSDGLSEVRSVVLEELETRVTGVGPSSSRPSNAGGGAPEEKEESLSLMHIHPFLPIGLAGQGPTTLDEEEEHLARQEKEDLQASLALSPEVARLSGLIVISLETSVGPTPWGRSPFANRGVLGSTFGEASSCPSDDQLFRRPFDIEARALKILGDLLLVQSRGIRKCHALDLTPSLDKEGLEPVERMLLEFLPDMWRELSELEETICLIDECTSQAEYRYYMLGERVRLSVGASSGLGSVRDEPHHERGGMPDEEALAKARNMTREKLEVELEQHWAEGMAEGMRHFFFQLLEMGQHANRAESLREQAKGAISKLLLVLDITRAKRDEVRDDVEDVFLAKQNLEQALAEATTEAGDPRLQKFIVEASIGRLSDQAAHAREETSRLLFELDVVKVKQDKIVDSATIVEEASWFSTEFAAFRSKAEAFHAHGADPNVNGKKCRSELEAVRGEVSMLQERVALLGSREAELLVESKVAWAEVAQLWTKLRPSQWRREEFERSHHSRSGYVKALLDLRGYYWQVSIVGTRVTLSAGVRGATRAHETRVRLNPNPNPICKT
ncbi:hypothetical protein ACLOJK_008242 [Asimina triloba]